MALPPYPLPRETRETGFLTGSDVATYGPFAFKIFDENDVDVWRLDAGATEWALQAVTVTKTAALAYDTFSVTFPATVPATTTFRVSGRRLHERQVAVTRGGAIDSIMLEKELSKQGAILQELRRDLGRTVRFPPGFDGAPFLPVMTAGAAIIVNAAGDGLTIGPDAADIAGAQGYAEDALAAKILAEAAAAAVENATQFIHVVKTGVIDGLGPYDMEAAIGAEGNLYLTIGNLPQAVGTYSIDGTTFTLESVDGIDGLPYEARIHGNVRELNAPADGSVTEDTLDTALAAKVNSALTEVNVNSIITADMDPWNAVFDGSPGDQAKVKAAALAAAAAGVPFYVPNKGFTWNEGLVIQVPEDFATIQEAHDAILNWIIPATPPKYVDTTQNHLSPVSLTISVSGIVHTQNLTNITWNHPQGDRIRLKGRGKTALTFASQQAVTYDSGTHPCRLRFSTWPATDPAVGSVIMPIVLTGSGAYQNFEGGWRITAVNNVNKDITFAAYAKTDTSTMTSIISSGLFYHIPCVLRFTNFISSGAVAGCIDVHTTLRMSDIAILGSPSNAPTTNGLIARAGASILLDQHCAILEHQRSGLWLLNDAHAQVGYSSFCGNGSGINNLQSVVDGSRTYIQGNTAYNLICGIGSTNSIVQSAFGGSGGAGILVNGNASFIGSGHSRRSDLGIDVKPGGFANINDMNVRANVTWDLRRRGGGRLMIVTSDYGTTDPAIDTGDSFGGFTALSATLDAVT